MITNSLLSPQSRVSSLGWLSTEKKNSFLSPKKKKKTSSFLSHHQYLDSPDTIKNKAKWAPKTFIITNSFDALKAGIDFLSKKKKKKEAEIDDVLPDSVADRPSSSSHEALHHPPIILSESNSMQRSSSFSLHSVQSNSPRKHKNTHYIEPSSHSSKDHLNLITQKKTLKLPQIVLVACILYSRR